MHSGLAALLDLGKGNTKTNATETMVGGFSILVDGVKLSLLTEQSYFY